mmetsp:Transcript_24515/g.37954  ORF Transcript_24515/g.37954 Transcript_24515/m.37954 type:complete len:230 (-) Transcript_24515:115-804(-)
MPGVDIAGHLPQHRGGIRRHLRPLLLRGERPAARGVRRLLGARRPRGAAARGAPGRSGRGGTRGASLRRSHSCRRSRGHLAVLRLREQHHHGGSGRTARPADDRRGGLSRGGLRLVFRGAAVSAGYLRGADGPARTGAAAARWCGRRAGANVGGARDRRRNLSRKVCSSAHARVKKFRRALCGTFRGRWSQGIERRHCGRPPGLRGRFLCQIFGLLVPCVVAFTDITAH